MVEYKKSRVPFPERPITRLTEPIQQFLRVQAASGVVLAACAAIALVLANGPFADAYRTFWDTRVRFAVGNFALDYPLWYWVNDGLMTIFFFVVGLEIKRELTSGELKDPKARVLPMIAALGGALVPVSIYLIFHAGTPAADGWAVPMATDIAFVVGFLAMFGKRVPNGLKVFLLSVAIVDDMFAVAVIALVFTSKLQVGYLLAAAAGFFVIAGLRVIGLRAIPVYFLVGAVIWLFTLKGGVHPTVAGVILGLLTPEEAWIPDSKLRMILTGVRSELRRKNPDRHEKTELLEDTETAVREAMSPLDRLEEGLHPWVAFGIMPIFALANAGVPISTEGVTSPVGLAVAGALLIGKPLGIVGATVLTVKMGWAKLPGRMTGGMAVAGGVLSGIGFTMSLFIASLGLKGELLDEAKTGVLMGSAVAAVLGMLLLWRMLPKEGATHPAH